MQLYTHLRCICRTRRRWTCRNLTAWQYIDYSFAMYDNYRVSKDKPIGRVLVHEPMININGSMLKWKHYSRDFFIFTTINNCHSFLLSCLQRFYMYICHLIANTYLSCEPSICKYYLSVVSIFLNHMVQKVMIADDISYYYVNIIRTILVDLSKSFKSQWWVTSTFKHTNWCHKTYHSANARRVWMSNA